MSGTKTRGRRFAGVASWFCFALCIVLATGWLASARWTMFFMAAQFGDSIMLKSGTAGYLWTSSELRLRLSQRFNEPIEPRWEWHFGERKTPIEWWPTWYVSTATGRRMVTVPLWVPLVFFAGGAAFFRWSAGREPSPGCCAKCGYNLDGLGSRDRCPECDSPFTRAYRTLSRLARRVCFGVPA
ncbi:MAG: hypothetical protein J0L78_12415 [Planctomycetes bacterium]|nr:hypothetical protein [Planctomycetota bacterium]